MITKFSIKKVLKLLRLVKNKAGNRLTHQLVVQGISRKNSLIHIY